jgi:leucine efflux protein
MNIFMHSTFGISDFWTFLLGTIVIVLLPGPNSLYVLSVAAQRGVREAYRGACGVFLGDFILMILSAGGVASLLKTSPTLFHFVKYIGAAYLAWIGLQMLRACWLKFRGRAPVAENTAIQTQHADPFRKALMISLLNPKAILFFISFFIQFVDPQFATPWLAFSVLGSVCEITSALYLTALIFAGARLAELFRQRQALSNGLSGGVGALFIGFGAKLATASL